MNISIKKVAPAIVAGTIALLLAGCSVPTISESDPKAASAEAPVTNVPAPPAENEMIKTFGGVVTYADGVSISVSKGEPYTPSQNSAGFIQGQTALLFNLVITNNSNQPLEPMTLSSATSGGIQASTISDMGNPEYGEVGMAPMTTILPGQTVTWIEAYSIKDVNDITFEVSPSVMYDDALFVTEK